jgi:dihydroorotase
MTFLIKQAEIIDADSPFHLQKLNILVEDGIISYIGNEIKPANHILEVENQQVSVGWFDMRASFGEPGYEHRETLLSGSLAAAEGGFTSVALLPNTLPVIQTKESVFYIINQSKEFVTELLPYAVVSKNLNGEELSEMMELNSSGCIGFTDANEPINHVGLLTRALQYVQSFDGIIIQHPEEKRMSAFGQMNEGIESTKLGLKGIPHLAEEIMVKRDLQVLAYTGGRIHFSRISSKETVNLISEAKQKGLNVSCDVAIPNLTFTDQNLTSFDTNFKVNPPLRLEEDRLALWEGLLNNTIDAIVSDHNPQEIENKFVAFDEAAFGMTNLETAFSALLAAKPHDFALEKLITKLTKSPRAILKQKQPKILEGEVANLTVFSTNFKWKYEKKHCKSISKNSPFLEKTLQGKSLAIFNKRKVYLSNFIKLA